MAEIAFRPVDIGNYYHVLMLEPTEEQRRFLWPNGAALAEACFVPDMTPEAVYAEDEMVGFVAWGPWHPAYSFTRPPEPGSWTIAHLMIGAAFQGRGLGRRLVEAMIARLRATPGCRRIVLSVGRDNERALALYATLGFHTFAMDDEGHPLLELVL